MLKKIIDFFTGKKTAPVEPVDTWQPAATAPYKVPEPAATTPIPDIPSVAVPIPYRFQPPAVAATNTPPVAVLISPETIAAIPIPVVVTNSNPTDNVPIVDKKKRTFTRKPAEPKAVAKPKPAAIKAPAKPRAKKPQ
jgi:hypothetical protein